MTYINTAASFARLWYGCFPEKIYKWIFSETVGEQVPLGDPTSVAVIPNAHTSVAVVGRIASEVVGSAKSSGAMYRRVPGVFLVVNPDISSTIERPKSVRTACPPSLIRMFPCKESKPRYEITIKPYGLTYWFDVSVDNPMAMQESQTTGNVVQLREATLDGSVYNEMVSVTHQIHLTTKSKVIACNVLRQTPIFVIRRHYRRS